MNEGKRVFGETSGVELLWFLNANGKAFLAQNMVLFDDDQWTSELVGLPAEGALGSSFACRSAANSNAHGSTCFLDARAKMGDSGCSTCTTSRMRLTTELATAAITVTQSSGNTMRSEMVVIDLPVPA